MELLKRYLYLYNRGGEYFAENLKAGILKDFAELQKDSVMFGFGSLFDAPNWLDVSNEDMMNAVLGNQAFECEFMANDPDLVMCVIEVAGVNPPEILYLVVG